jgi:hypothetical protein
MTGFNRSKPRARFLRKFISPLLAFVLLFSPVAVTAQTNPFIDANGNHVHGFTWFLQVAVCTGKSNSATNEDSDSCYHFENRRYPDTGIEYKSKVNTYKWATVAGPYRSEEQCDEEDEKYLKDFYNSPIIGRIIHNGTETISSTFSHACRYAMGAEKYKIHVFSENPMPLDELLKSGYWPDAYEPKITGEIRNLEEGSTLGSFILCNKIGNCFEFTMLEPEITINGKHLAQQTSFPRRGIVKYHVTEDGENRAESIKTF